MTQDGKTLTTIFTSAERFRAHEKIRFLVLMAVAMLVTPRLANGAVSMSYDAAAPTLGADDQYDLTDDAEVPGGTTPGGGEYNKQAFSDNAGPPGQTFTTPSGGGAYQITSVSLKGANTGGLLGLLSLRRRR